MTWRWWPRKDRTVNTTRTLPKALPAETVRKAAQLRGRVDHASDRADRDVQRLDEVTEAFRRALRGRAT